MQRPNPHAPLNPEAKQAVPAAPAPVAQPLRANNPNDFKALPPLAARPEAKPEDNKKEVKPETAQPESFLPVTQAECDEQIKKLKLICDEALSAQNPFKLANDALADGLKTITTLIHIVQELEEISKRTGEPNTDMYVPLGGKSPHIVAVHLLEFSKKTRRK